MEEIPQKKRPGRPKGSTKNRAPEELGWADLMFQLYEEGASDTEICKALKVTYAEFDKRCKSDPIFQQVVDYGRTAAKAWWLELGRKGAAGKIHGFSFQPWYANMKNRFGWSDKVENVVGDDKPIDQLSKDELAAKLSAYKDRLTKLLKTQNIFVNGPDSSN